MNRYFCALFCGAILTSTPVFAQSTTCGGTGPYADAILARVRELVTRTSPAADELRSTYHLPTALATDVQFVATDSICNAASVALMRILGRTTSGTRTWVIRIGASRYWVYDPTYTFSDMVSHVVFDTSWNGLTIIAQD